MAGEIGAHSRLGDGDGIWLAGLQVDSAPSAALSAGTPATSSRKQRADDYADSGGGDVALWLGDAGAWGGGADLGQTGLWMADAPRHGV